jgi:hypothetical protein
MNSESPAESPCVTDTLPSCAIKNDVWLDRKALQFLRDRRSRVAQKDTLQPLIERPYTQFTAARRGWLMRSITSLPINLFA